MGGKHEAFTIEQLASFFDGEFSRDEIQQYVAGVRPQRESAVFVGGLSWATSEARLREFFCADLRRAELYLDASGRSRGFAKVCFNTPAGHEAALARSGQNLDGRQILVRDFESRGRERQPEHEVFVESLSWHTGEDQLRQHFEDCGEILSCKVFYHKSGEPKGCGKLAFASAAAAASAAKKHLSDLDGWTLAVRPAHPARRRRPTGAETWLTMLTRNCRRLWAYVGFTAVQDGAAGKEQQEKGACIRLLSSRASLLRAVPELGLAEWLQLLEPRGFLLCYLSTLASTGCRTARDVAERYIQEQAGELALEELLFEKLKVRKLGHRRLLQRWFADLTR
ncbi:unnamed protein product [Effrenium voratum]|nr:unnamed protein product [Effrenium voratum]